jgi:hypothetical protein
VSRYMRKDGRGLRSIVDVNTESFAIFCILKIPSKVASLQSNNLSYTYIEMAHPFLVDQRTYLARTSSATPASLSGLHSLYAQSTTSEISRTSLSTRTKHVRTLSIESTRSFKSTCTAAESQEAQKGVDAACLRFMASASESPYLFGSISSRSSPLSAAERTLRREVQELMEGCTVDVKGDRQGKGRKKRFGRIF